MVSAAQPDADLVSRDGVGIDSGMRDFLEQGPRSKFSGRLNHIVPRPVGS